MASFGQTFDASSVEPSSGYEVLPPSVLEIDRALQEIASLVGVKLPPADERRTRKR